MFRQFGYSNLRFRNASVSQQGFDFCRSSENEHKAVLFCFRFSFSSIFLLVWFWLLSLEEVILYPLKHSHVLKSGLLYWLSCIPHVASHTTRVSSPPSWLRQWVVAAIAPKRQLNGVWTTVLVPNIEENLSIIFGRQMKVEYMYYMQLRITHASGLCTLASWRFRVLHLLRPSNFYLWDVVYTERSKTTQVIAKKSRLCNPPWQGRDKCKPNSADHEWRAWSYLLFFKSRNCHSIFGCESRNADAYTWVCRLTRHHLCENQSLRTWRHITSFYGGNTNIQSRCCT